MTATLKIRPGTARGTALAVEGPVEAGHLLTELDRAAPAPSTASRRFPFPFRGGVSS
jgi:hypothetical protein